MTTISLILALKIISMDMLKEIALTSNGGDRNKL